MSPVETDLSPLNMCETIETPIGNGRDLTSA